MVYSFDDYYFYDRTYPLSEEKHVQALAQARLDNHVLSCQHIFVGGPLGVASRENTLEVLVERPLHGAPAEGERVLVKVESHPTPRVGERWLVQTELQPIPLPGKGPFIYFIRGHEQDKAGRRVYEVETRWSIEALQTVIESLKRRHLYPIREVVEPDGKTRHHQEVVFLGPRVEALAMLESGEKPLEILGARRIIHDGKEAIPDVLAAIERELWSEDSESGSFSGQANRIRLLGILEDHRTDGEVARLIESILAKAQAGAGFPVPAPAANDPPKRKRRRYQELDDDDNHSLAWLLLTLDDAEVAQRFGRRLLAMRDLTAYGWKDEAQFVLDACHVEDHLQRATVEPRSREIRSRRWTAGFQGSLRYYRLAFSADDKWLAVVDSEAGRVWNTSDWSLAGEFAHSASVQDLAFSADGQRLFVATEGRDTLADIWDWREGKVIQHYAAYDPKVWAQYLGEKPVATGKHPFPPRDLAWGERSESVWCLENVNTSADSRESIWLRQRRRSNPLVVMLERRLTFPASGITMTADRGMVAVYSRTEPFGALERQLSGLMHEAGAEIEIFKAPDWKSVARWTLPGKTTSSASRLQLSHEGRWIAATLDDRYPKLLDARSGRPIPLGSGHSDLIVKLQSGAAVGEFQTQDADGTICRWNAQTGALLERLEDPTKRIEHVHWRKDQPDSFIAEDGRQWSFEGLGGGPYGHYTEFEIRVSNKASKREQSPDRDKGNKGKRLGVVETKWGQYEPLGLVPGGEYLHIGTQIFSRRDLKPISAANVSGEFDEVVFSTDGRHYALLTSETESRPSPLGYGVRELHEISQRLRVHNTLTGEAVFSRPITRHARLVALSANGDAVATVNDRQQVEVWPLPP